MVRIKVTRRDDGDFDIVRTEHGPHYGCPKMQTAQLAVPEDSVDQWIGVLKSNPSSERMSQAYQDIRIIGWPQ